MTVAELRKELDKYSDDDVVMVSDTDGIDFWLSTVAANLEDVHFDFPDKRQANGNFDKTPNGVAVVLRSILG